MSKSHGRLYSPRLLLAGIALASVAGGIEAGSAGAGIVARAPRGAIKNFKVCMGTGGDPSLTWTTGQGVVLQAIVKKEGWSSVILSNNNSASTALNNVQVFIQDHCNVVVEFNGQPSANPVMAAKLAAAKIPAITYDIAQKGWYFVGINDSKVGLEAGQALGNVIKKRWNCKLDALVAGQGYSAGIVNTERTGGAIAGVRKVCPGISANQVFSINTGGQVSTALPLARALLAAHPTWNRIAAVGINDSAVTGILEAAQQLGRFKNAIGWGSDGSLITGPDVNPHLLGSIMYFLEGYPEYALSIIKDIQEGHAPPMKDDVNGHSPAILVPPCGPVTATQAKAIPDYGTRLKKMIQSAPGTKEISLFCPIKGS